MQTLHLQMRPLNVDREIKKKNTEIKNWNPMMNNKIQTYNTVRQFQFLPPIVHIYSQSCQAWRKHSRRSAHWWRLPQIQLGRPVYMLQHPAVKKGQFRRVCKPHAQLRWSNNLLHRSCSLVKEEEEEEMYQYWTFRYCTFWVLNVPVTVYGWLTALHTTAFG